MNILTIYKTMEESIKLCPKGENIKFLFRHSIREEIMKGASNADMQKAELTREGRIMAERLGESFDFDIGSVSSSHTQRCIDTCKEIINGYKGNHIQNNYEIILSKMLQCPHLDKEKNVSKELKTWEKLGTEGIFDCFAKNIEMLGFFDLEKSSKRIINYIFNTGNKKNTIDLFCTHDFQLAMLLLYFNKNKNEFKEKLFNDKEMEWPFMLEGMFLWGNENSYSAIWRGKEVK